MRCLLAEDDAGLSKALARGLREQAYVVDVSTDGEDALLQARINPYAAIILDLGLPTIDGLTICRLLRAEGHTERILMLTARGGVEDRIAGLDSGADDYLPKPFDFDELLARLRALLRRNGERLLPMQIAIDDLLIDFAAQSAYRGGAPVDLTSKEFTLLAYLARNTGRVVGRAELTEHVWDQNHDPAGNAVEVYINRLRRKIDRPGYLPLIHTRRGAGYSLGLTHDAGAPGS